LYLNEGQMSILKGRFFDKNESFRINYFIINKKALKSFFYFEK